jgi:Peptidase M15
MRAHVGVSACAQSIDRQARLRSFVLLPAVVVTAAAMHAPVALARPSDIHWEGGASPRFQNARHVEEQDDDEARPRRRSSRSHAGVRRREHRQARAAKSRRSRAAASRSARAKAPAQRAAPRARQAVARLAAIAPAAGIVPLEQRSLVAMHPLAPDPIFAVPALEVPFDPAPLPQAAAPRCKTAHPNSFALAVASFERGFRPSEPAMVEGAWPHCRGARNPQSSLRLASLAPTVPAPDPATSPSLSGGSINWRASGSCLASPLRAILGLVASNFGPLTVNSTCRSRSHNARVGGAPRSMHLTGNAVDFRIRGRYGDVLAFLLRQRSVGGFKHYGSGVFHIDTGPRRTWGARRARAARRA